MSRGLGDVYKRQITFIAGYLGATMGAVMNWPDAGAIVAITVMGFFILKRMKKDE